MLKSLILKDLYGIRFQLIASALLFLLPHMLCLFVGVGLTVDENAANAVGAVALYGVMNYITITVFSSLFLNTIADDIQSGWARFQRTLPLTVGQLIGGKLLASLVLIAVMAAVSILLNLVVALAGNPYVEALIALPIIFGCLQVIALMPVFPLSIKIGVKTANLLYVVFLIVTAIAAVVAAFMVGANDLPPELTRVIFYIILPLLAAGVTVDSYSLGKKALENSEE